MDKYHVGQVLRIVRVNPRGVLRVWGELCTITEARDYFYVNRQGEQLCVYGYSIDVHGREMVAEEWELAPDPGDQVLKQLTEEYA